MPEIEKGELKQMIAQTSSIATAVTSAMTSSNLGGFAQARGGGGGGGAAVVNMFMCPVGSDCYKSKQSELLKKTMDANKKTAQDIPMDLSQSEKNYYVYNGGNTGGEAIYSQLIIDRFATTAEEFKQNSIEKQQQFMSDLLQSIKQYQAALIFQNQMANLLKTRRSEQADLKKNVNYYEKVLHTSERKFVYENKNMDSLYMYRRILIFLYYGALVCFIIFGNFIPDKLYNKWSVWLIIVIAAIFPIILNMLMMWLFLLYDTLSYWFAELPHKDVYFNMDNSANEKPPGGLTSTPPLGG
jgi:hypothetical protein